MIGAYITCKGDIKNTQNYCGETPKGEDHLGDVRIITV
jgi:hypothetical protein